MLNFNLLMTATEGTNKQGSMWPTLIMVGLLFVFLYFFMIRPQKKQEKKDAEMRANLEIGDKVVTIGGVIGRVVAIADDSILLETGKDRVKIRFTKSAIATVEKLNLDSAKK